MIKFSREKVLLLHQLIAQETGGSVGLRNANLLDSALEQIYAGVGESEFYPSKREKAARLGFSLITNHAFVDGNKRIGMFIMITFLELNGIEVNCPDEAIVEAGLGVAAGTMNYDALLAWVKKYT